MKLHSNTIVAIVTLSAGFGYLIGYEHASAKFGSLTTRALNVAKGYSDRVDTITEATAPLTEILNSPEVQQIITDIKFDEQTKDF